jgi:hypothetical protein
VAIPAPGDCDVLAHDPVTGTRLGHEPNADIAEIGIVAREALRLGQRPDPLAALDHDTRGLRLPIFPDRRAEVAQVIPQRRATVHVD